MAGPVSERCANYLFKRGHATVEGWVAPGALTAMRLLMLAQERMGIEGNLAEIGVHHGRYFLAMILQARPGERFVAVDIFEEQHLNVDKSGKGDRAMFLQNLTDHGPPNAVANTDIIQGDSTQMSPKDLMKDPNGGRLFRFFSVDGGHTVHHVKKDLGLAEATLVPGGIVVVDDFFNLDWPGVAEGVFFYLASNESKLTPFMYGDNKLYLTNRDYCEKYRLALEDDFNKAQYRKDTVLHDNPTVRVSFKAPEVVFAEDEHGNTVDWAASTAAPLPASIKLGSGWTQPSAHGVWSTGERAEMSLNLSHLKAGSKAKIQLEIYPYSRGSEPREITIKVDDGPPARHVLEPSALEVVSIIADVSGASLNLAMGHTPIGSPKSNGTGEDGRELGVLLVRISATSA